MSADPSFRCPLCGVQRVILHARATIYVTTQSEPVRGAVIVMEDPGDWCLPDDALATCCHCEHQAPWTDFRDAFNRVHGTPEPY